MERNSNAWPPKLSRFGSANSSCTFLGFPNSKATPSPRLRNAMKYHRFSKTRWVLSDFKRFLSDFIKRLCSTDVVWLTLFQTSAAEDTCCARKQKPKNVTGSSELFMECARLIDFLRAFSFIRNLTFATASLTAARSFGAILKVPRFWKMSESDSVSNSFFEIVHFCQSIVSASGVFFI